MKRTAAASLLVLIAACSGSHPTQNTNAGDGGTTADAGDDATRTTDGGPSQTIASIAVGTPLPVLAPMKASACAAPPSCASSSSINCWGGLASLADEHSSILPPGTLPGHPNDYVFFVPTKTCLNSDSTSATGSTSGLVVLTGGTGPSATGQWTLDYPDDYGAYDETIAGTPVKGHGQIFLSPMNRTSCPSIAAASQDPTFDLNYANPGSVVVDPTANGTLLMLYEGTNRCVGSTGAQDDKFYSTLGIATSIDQGRTWPAYRAAMTPLPEQSTTTGPNAADGAFADKVCAGNDCSATHDASYGRYAVLGAPISVARFVAAGQPLPAKATGDSEPSAFVDDAGAAAAGGTYVYTVQNSSTGGFAYPGAANGGELTVARAKLGGVAPLVFTKWYGSQVAYGTSAGASFDLKSATITGAACGPGSTAQTTCMISNDGLGSRGGGLGSPIFPQDPSNGAAATATCQASNQVQSSASISFVDATNEYLLLFVCTTPIDPANPSAATPAPGTRGAAWFYSTLDATKSDLSHQEAWTAPKEISGTFAWLKDNANASGGCPPKGCSKCVYDGWYSTAMSPGVKAGHLAAQGFVFSMNGCLDTGAGGPREFESRTFALAFGTR